MLNLLKEVILMKFNSMGAKSTNARYHHISLIQNTLIMGKILKQYAKRVANETNGLVDKIFKTLILNE